jgi:hypothetical protein
MGIQRTRAEPEQSADHAGVAQHFVVQLAPHYPLNLVNGNRKLRCQNWAVGTRVDRNNSVPCSERQAPWPVSTCFRPQQHSTATICYTGDHLAHPPLPPQPPPPHFTLSLLRTCCSHIHPRGAQITSSKSATFSIQEIRVAAEAAGAAGPREATALRLLVSWACPRSTPQHRPSPTQSARGPDSERGYHSVMHCR